MKPEGQLHTGLWLTTWHNAFHPQVPEQGSMHFWLLQAWFLGQSELITHSGLQLGGLPRNPGTQEHTAWLFITLHLLLGPQGDGLQGFTCACSKLGTMWFFLFSNFSVKITFFLLIIPSIVSQEMKALPAIPAGQEHMGIWFRTLQIAFLPQVPGHGSTHLFRTQALFKGQSLLRTHSGRQLVYGSPW